MKTPTPFQIGKISAVIVAVCWLVMMLAPEVLRGKAALFTAVAALLVGFPFLVIAVVVMWLAHSGRINRY